MVVNLSFGLGNQMFIYAFGEYLRRVKGFDVRYNLQGFKMKGERKLEINKFPNVLIPEDKCIFTPNVNINGRNLKNDIKKFVYYKLLGHHYKRCWRSFEFDKEFVDQLQEKDLVFGFFQTEDYAKQIEPFIRKSFGFGSVINKRVVELKKQIESCDSVSLHVRRGDYVGSETFKVLDKEYYNQAVSKLEKLAENKDFVFFIFSDDPQWVKKNITGLRKYHSVVVEGNSAFDDMHLMSCCKYNIIANSSFSWWAAWLNKSPSKIVIAPSTRRWYLSERLNRIATNYVPKKWIQIDY